MPRGMGCSASKYHDTVGDRSTLLQNHASVLPSFLKDVYRRRLAVHVPIEETKNVGPFLARGPAGMRLDYNVANAIAAQIREKPRVCETIKKEKPRTAPIQAAWSPARDDSSVIESSVILEDMHHIADQLISNRAFVGAMAHVSSLPFQLYFSNSNLPASPLEWDVRALSRQNYFTTVGIALDPGNETLAAILLGLSCRTAAAVYCNEEWCKACVDLVPDVLCGVVQTVKMFFTTARISPLPSLFCRFGVPSFVLSWCC